MEIRGDQAIVSMLDRAAYEDFLRTNGMSARRIRRLRVTFRPQFRTLLGKPDEHDVGHYNMVRHHITLATWYLQETDTTHEEKQAFINTVLVHESGHACLFWPSVGGNIVQILLGIGVILATSFGVTSLSHALHVDATAQVLLFTACMGLVYLTLTRLSYRVSPAEWLARRFERQHAGTVIIRLPDE